MKIIQSLFFTTHVFIIVLILVHMHILKIMDFSVVELRYLNKRLIAKQR